MVLNGFLVAAALALLGLLGAAAFNPDDGFLVRSEPLWRTFGIAAYVGWIGLPLVALAGLAAVIWGQARPRIRRRGEP